MVKGENEENFFKDPNNDVYYPSAKQYDPLAQAKTPSANPLYFNTLSLESSYMIIKNLEISGGLNWTIVTGKRRGHAVDLYTGVTYTIR